MKLRHLLYVLGVRPRAREHSYEIVRFQLPRDGTVAFARSVHPGVRRKEIRQAAVDALREFLREGDSAVDIGAHMGDTTVPIGLAVGREGIVFAFEPNPYIFRVLEINASLNPEKTHIVPFRYAATDEDGEFFLESTDPSFRSGAVPFGEKGRKRRRLFRVRVEGRNVLKLLAQHYPERLERLRYVKIDTDGYDRAVVASLRAFLRERRPYLKTEFYKHLPEEERCAYYRELRELGYRLFRCVDDATYRGPELTLRDLGARENFDAFAVP